MGRKAWERGRETKHTLRAIWERHCWFRKCSHTNIGEKDTSLGSLRDWNVRFPVSCVVMLRIKYFCWLRHLQGVIWAPATGMAGAAAAARAKSSSQLSSLSPDTCTFWPCERSFLQHVWYRNAVPVEQVTCFWFCRQKSHLHYFPTDLFKSVFVR